MGAQVATGELDREIAALADRQHGVVDHRQLVALGASRRHVGRRIEAGRLLVLHRGVYAVGHRRLVPNGRRLAAVLACGEGALLSHASAAALWDLAPDPSGSRQHVTVSGSGGRAARHGLVVHRGRDAPGTRIDGVPVTTVTRTLVDLAGVVRRPALQRALEAAEAQRRLDAGAVLRTAIGRPGAPALRMLLATELPVTRSVFEAEFLELCRRWRLPAPAVNARIGGYEVDFAWVERRVVVECDSFAFHRSRAAFERDRARDVELGRLGFRVLRFTHRQVTSDSAWVADALADALRRDPLSTSAP